MDFREVSTILFDLDRTLITDPFEDHILPEVCIVVSTRRGCTIEEAKELFLILHKRHLPGIDAYDWNLIFKEMDAGMSGLELWHKYRKKMKPYPDVLPVLDKLADRFRLGILTDSFKEFTDLKLKQTGIAPYFGKVLNADEIGYAKPDPKFFEHALREMRLEANNVIYVGDNPKRDVPGAKELGITTVIVNRVGNPIPYKVKPTIEIKILTELLNNLDVT